MTYLSDKMYKFYYYLEDLLFFENTTQKGKIWR